MSSRAHVGPGESTRRHGLGAPPRGLGMGVHGAESTGGQEAPGDGRAEGSGAEGVGEAAELGQAPRQPEPRRRGTSVGTVPAARAGEKSD